MSKRNLRKSTLGLALVAAVGVAACGDDLTGVEEHGEAAGVELVMNGQIIASFTFDATTNAWTGEMEVDEGQETPHITVNFVDADGDVIDFASDPDHYLEVDVEDESIAMFEQDTPGEFGGHLHGESAGETTVVFKLMHGALGSGHVDLETAPVHAHVN